VRPLFHPAVNDITVEGIHYALSHHPVRAQIYTEMLASECPLNCSNFRKVDNRTLPKATLSQHFKILREAGLIRSERKGVEMHNATRCTELKERFADMLSAILNTYLAQNSRRTAFRPEGHFPSNARRRSLHEMPSNRSDQR
jgi:DNA-binding transcriptional ArsR family regulator